MPCTAIPRLRMLRHGAALKIAACGYVVGRDRNRVDFDTLKLPFSAISWPLDGFRPCFMNESA